MEGSPLRAAPDALTIDTSSMGAEEAFQAALREVHSPPLSLISSLCLCQAAAPLCLLCTAMQGEAPGCRRSGLGSSGRALPSWRMAACCLLPAATLSAAPDAGRVTRRFGASFLSSSRTRSSVRRYLALPRLAAEPAARALCLVPSKQQAAAIPVATTRWPAWACALLFSQAMPA